MFENASPLDTGRDNDPMPEGFHRKMRLISAKMFRGTMDKSMYFKAKFEILESDNLNAVGTFGDVFDRLDGNKFPSYDNQAQGRTLALCGALAGFEPAKAVGKVSAREVALMCDDSQPFKNRIIAGRAKRVGQTKKGEPIVRTEFSPVLENGAPAEFSEGDSVPANTNAVAPSVPTLPTAPATPTDNLSRALAAGFVVHPANPDYYFKGREVKTKAQLINGEF